MLREILEWLRNAVCQRRWRQVVLLACLAGIVVEYLGWVLPLSSSEAGYDLWQTLEESPKLLIFPIFAAGCSFVALFFPPKEVYERRKTLLWGGRIFAVLFTLLGTCYAWKLTTGIPRFEQEGRVNILIARPYSPVGKAQDRLEAWYKLWSALRASLPNPDIFDVKLLDREIRDRPGEGCEEAKRYLKRTNAHLIIWGTLYHDRQSITITPCEPVSPVRRLPAQSGPGFGEITSYAQGDGAAGVIAVAARLAAAEAHMRSLDPRNLESVRDAYDSAWVAAQQTSSHDRGLIRLLLAKCHLGLEQQLAETKKAEKLALTEESLAHAKASLQLLDKQSLDLRCLACYLKGICMAEKARFKRLSKGQRESCYKVAEAAFTEASRSQQCLPQVWQGRALVSYARYKNTRDRKHLDEVKNSLLEANKCRPGFGAYGLACVCSLLHECAWRRWIKTAMSCNMLLGPEELRKAADKGGDLEWARQQDPEWFEGFVTAVKEREQSASR